MGPDVVWKTEDPREWVNKRATIVVCDIAGHRTTQARVDTKYDWCVRFGAPGWDDLSMTDTWPDNMAWSFFPSWLEKEKPDEHRRVEEDDNH